MSEVTRLLAYWCPISSNNYLWDFIFLFVTIIFQILSLLLDKTPLMKEYIYFHFYSHNKNHLPCKCNDRLINYLQNWTFPHPHSPWDVVCLSCLSYKLWDLNPTQKPTFMTKNLLPTVHFPDYNDLACFPHLILDLFSPPLW